jgi:glycine/D-amino acid oxidase-like deaminating enzyme
MPLRKLDLRSGRPVWSAYRAPAVPVTALRRDARTDVLVVGMGVSGAMVAEMLAAAGRGVMLIDRRGPVRGSTPASTALVQHELDTPLVRLAAGIGRSRATRAWRRSRLALGNLEAHVAELGIRCDLAPRPSLYLAGDLLDAAELEREGRERRSAGLAARFLDAAELRAGFGIARKGALLSHGNLALDPRKLTAGLLRRARAHGARLCAPVEATGFAHSSDAVEVATRGGPVISSRHVVLATGYELAPPVPARGHSIVSTWAIATRPQPRRIWPQAALIWEASDPYLYLRATQDGRVVCGGEDEPFADEEARDALIAAKAATLSEKLAALLPDVDPAPEFAWTGSFGTTGTGLPVIRQLPRRPRMHAVLGYGGNGITFSRIAAELIATELAGGSDADADLFRGDA